MAKEILEGTPLEEYFNETNTAEDWGIESDGSFNDQVQTEGASSGLKPLEPLDSETKGTPSNDTRRISAQTRFKGPNLATIPLALGKGRNLIEEERFRQSLRSLLCQKVSTEETSRFLDQFHYSIVSSGLLEAQPLYNTWSLCTDSRRRRLLFDQKMPWTHLYVEPVFRATGSSGIVSLCVLLHYKYKLSSAATERAAVALIISIAIILYFFATSRRRLLRSLRKKNLFYIEMFIQSAKCFDGDCVKAIRDIQDIDITSNGFAPFSKQSFLAANSTAGRRLRAVLASSLHLMKEAFLDAFKDLVNIGNKAVLEQFLEIYDLRAQMTELNFEISEHHVGFVEYQAQPHLESEFCYSSVSYLKRELNKVHMLRRAVLCCLLSADSSGRSTPSELEIWTTICDHLHNGSVMEEQLSNVIINERTRDLDERDTLQRKRPPPAFIDAFAKMRHLASKFEVAQDPYLTPIEVEDQLGSIQGAIDELSQSWAIFLQDRKQKAESIESVAVATPSCPTYNHELSSLSSPTSIMTPELSESGAFGSFSTPELSDVTSEGNSFSSSRRGTLILEGEAPRFVLPKSGLTRAERIEVSKKERSAAKESSLYMSRNCSLMLELNSVLSRRH